MCYPATNATALRLEGPLESREHEERFEPVPFMTVSEPRQLKAFTDPLRLRVLTILMQGPATNQQIADLLDEPHAKVLHHVRTLLDAEMIRLVETRVSGGNVEKYYRAVARLFGMRPVAGEEIVNVVGTEFQVIQQEVTASFLAWPEQKLQWESRRVRLPQERVDEFHRRLIELVGEFWGGPSRIVEEDPEAPLSVLAAVIYRDPNERGPESEP